MHVGVNFLCVSDVLHEDFIINPSKGALILDVAVQEGKKNYLCFVCVRRAEAPWKI